VSPYYNDAILNMSLCSDRNVFDKRNEEGPNVTSLLTALNVLGAVLRLEGITLPLTLKISKYFVYGSCSLVACNF
jgi:hypothetical protein